MAIVTAEVIHSIPGIRAFKKVGPAYAPDERKSLDPRIEIVNLTTNQIPDFMEVMHKGIDRRRDISDAEKDAAKAKRSSEFYQDVLKDSAKTVLVARDPNSGIIIGGLEGEESIKPEDRIDNQRFGYVLWVAVDPDTKIRGVATELYSRYEEHLREIGCGFLIGNIDHSNRDSSRHHKRVGMGHTFLEKTSSSGERGTSRWLFKQIGLVHDSNFPVIEVDYLPASNINSAELVAQVMSEVGLGGVAIARGDKTRGSDVLVTVSSENPVVRGDFEYLMCVAAESINGNLDTKAVIAAAKNRLLRRQIIKQN